MKAKPLHGYGSQRKEAVRTFLVKHKLLAEKCFNLDGKYDPEREINQRKIIRFAREEGLYSPNTYYLDAWRGLYRVWRKMMGRSCLE